MKLRTKSTFKSLLAPSVPVLTNEGDADTPALVPEVQEKVVEDVEEEIETEEPVDENFEIQQPSILEEVVVQSSVMNKPLVDTPEVKIEKMAPIAKDKLEEHKKIVDLVKKSAKE